MLEGLDGVRPGDQLIVLTWLDRARRDVLRVHPRNDLSNPERGVFGTRSADRPNPITTTRAAYFAATYPATASARSSSSTPRSRPLRSSGWQPSRTGCGGYDRS